MANHKSAAKRARQDEKRRLRNRQTKGQVKSAVKTVRVALDAGQTDEAGAGLREAERQLRRAASKGVIPAKRASRRISRLARAVARASK